MSNLGWNLLDARAGFGNSVPVLETLEVGAGERTPRNLGLAFGRAEIRVTVMSFEE